MLLLVEGLLMALVVLALIGCRSRASHRAARALGIGLLGLTLGLLIAFHHEL